MAARPRRLDAGTALQKDQKRPLGSVGVGDLAREDGDLLAVWPAVIEGNPKLVLGQDKSRRLMADDHTAILSAATA